MQKHKLRFEDDCPFTQCEELTDAKAYSDCIQNNIEQMEDIG